MKPLESVLIKPAGPDCNMTCRYCFYSCKAELFPQTKIHRMTDTILKTTVKQVMRQGGRHVSFGWQGGEPTLTGKQFYEKAVNYQRIFGKPGQTAANGLQTNGILIDKNWARFLHEYRFLVGLSLDGPENIHNRYRVLRGETPGWDRVIKARDTLLTSGVEVNALTVVTAYSVRFPEEIYKFHRDNGLKFMQFIPCVEADPAAPDGIADFSVKPKDYGKFLSDIFDLWISDFRQGRPATSVRWFDSVFFSYAGLEAPECTLQEECGKYVVIEHNGNVYSCDFFVEPEWKLGNVINDKLTDLLNSPLQNKFGSIKKNLHESCRKCPWLQYCRGGCPKYRRYGTSGSAEPAQSYLCESYRIFFKHADSVFKKLAADWKKQNRT